MNDYGREEEFKPLERELQKLRNSKTLVEAPNEDLTDLNMQQVTCRTESADDKKNQDERFNDFFITSELGGLSR